MKSNNFKIKTAKILLDVKSIILKPKKPFKQPNFELEQSPESIKLLPRLPTNYENPLDPLRSQNTLPSSPQSYSISSPSTFWSPSFSPPIDFQSSSSQSSSNNTSISPN